MSGHGASALVRTGLERLAVDEIRVDGQEKVSGRAAFSADFAREGMLWAAFVRSPHAHARIRSIDASAARALPGVHAVLTAAEIGERRFGQVLADWTVLAHEKVRFVGDPVAAVAAETRELAEAAAALVEVRYDPLPALLDPEEAIASETIIHEHGERYSFGGRERAPRRHANVQGQDLVVRGDVDAGFARAVRVFEHTFFTPRYFAGYVEPRATLVWIDANGCIRVISTNKGPFNVRQKLAAVAEVPVERVIVEPSYIGGDFGAKGLPIDEFGCYFLARATGRPVKYVRPYSEDIQCGTTRQAVKTTLCSGIDADGKLVALRGRQIIDGGAYAAGKVNAALIPGLYLNSPYAYGAMRFERICAYTNLLPSGNLRDPGGVPLVFPIESHIDMVARELGIDPLAFRRRHAIRSEDELDLDGGHFAEPRGVQVLDALHAAADWDRPLPPGHGRGVALTPRHIGGGTTGVKLALTPTGALELRIGATEQGAGVLTVAGRVAATVLDVDPQRIHVSRGDTGAVPADPGTGASRATHIVGRATENAARELRAKLEAVGYPAVGWETAVAALAREGGVEVTGTYGDQHGHDEPVPFDFCGYVVEVSVDRETGAVTIHDVVFAADVGTVINPVAHRGQIDGGFAFGLGHALTEELRFEDGRMVNPSLAEYKIPTFCDMPPFRVILLTDARGHGPFGAKMAGELSTAAVPAAVANAIADACGARMTQLPLTAERIFDALCHPEPVEGTHESSPPR